MSPELAASDVKLPANIRLLPSVTTVATAVGNLKVTTRPSKDATIDVIVVTEVGCRVGRRACDVHVRTRVPKHGVSVDVVVGLSAASQDCVSVVVLYDVAGDSVT